MIKSDPAVANVIVFTGGGGATNTGFIYIALKPLSERKIGAAEIINRLRPKIEPAAGRFGIPPGRTGSAHRGAGQ